MKKILSIVLVFLILIALVACGKVVTPDYNDAASFEADLNNGVDATGKVVKFECKELIPDSAFGYNITAGEHLNFCSTSNPNVKQGDIVTVKISGVQSLLGSWIISYEIIK